jgi:hypothetical protein
VLPIPESPQSPLGSDPFANDPRQGRGLYVVVLVVFLAIAGATVWWVLSTVMGDDDDATPAPVTTAAPADTVPSTEVAPEETVPPETVPPETVPPETVPPETVPPSTAPEPVNYLNGVAAAEVLAEVARVVAGEDNVDAFRLVEVVLYPEYIIMQVQDPAVPEYVDRVVWRNGGVASREPVMLPPNTDVAAKVFRIDDVQWAAVDGLVAVAPELTEVVEGEVSHVYVQRWLPFSTDVRTRVFVSGPRSSGFLDAAADGTILSVTTG